MGTVKEANRFRDDLMIIVYNSNIAIYPNAKNQ